MVLRASLASQIICQFEGLTTYFMYPDCTHHGTTHYKPLKIANLSKIKPWSISGFTLLLSRVPTRVGSLSHILSRVDIDISLRYQTRGREKRKREEESVNKGLFANSSFFYGPIENRLLFPIGHALFIPRD